MKNCTMKVEGTKLTITVDLSERHGLSSTGKSETVASTEGNQPVEGFPAIKVGLNVFTPAPKK